MNKTLIPNTILILLMALLSCFGTSCSNDSMLGEEKEPVINVNPPPVDENQPAQVEEQAPLEIKVDRDIFGSSNGADLLIYTVELENLSAYEGKTVGVHFVYEIVIPTDEFTLLYNDPSDPDSGYRSDSDVPILYRIVETEQNKVESWGGPDEKIRQFSIQQPENALSIRYWVEVVTMESSDYSEEVFIDIPYATMGDVILQGGPIT